MQVLSSFRARPGIQYFLDSRWSLSRTLMRDGNDKIYLENMFRKLNKKILIVCSAILLLCLSLPARGESLGEKFDLSGTFLSILRFQTDSDFDGSHPSYNKSGQTVGEFVTYVNPKLQYSINPETWIFYESELGMDAWSRNNPDFASGEDKKALIFKQRQLYGETEFTPKFSLRAGYQKFEDPSGLFLNHWLGAVSSQIATGPVLLNITFGELPDQTREGFDLDRINFHNDILVGSVTVARQLPDNLDLGGGLSYLYDGAEINHARWLFTPVLSLRKNLRDQEIGGDIALQYGEAQLASFGGNIEKTLAWAAQGYARLRPSPLQLDLQVMALSPDDDYDHNGKNYAFFYSGKSRASTMILTEDSIRDWGDNLDERLSEQTGESRGNFFLLRSGFLLLDGKIGYPITPQITPALILGAALTLNPNNALGNTFIGTEADLDFQYTPSQNIKIDLVNSFFYPGKAASANVNTINLENQRPLYRLVTSVSFLF